MSASLDDTKMFASDNAAGASGQIVDAVVRVAFDAQPAYGLDPVTASARMRMSEVFERDVDLHFVATGSAANSLALAALARPWGSILCHRSSHIQVDECGGPEFFTGGAKLVLLDGDDGKVDPAALQRAARDRVGDVHSAQPQVLSITQATETGSVYTLDEIGTLTDIARDAGLRVHMDGARFANALVSVGANPAEMSWRAGVDILSFGVTKNGGMTTDAVVSFDPTLAGELAFRVKRAGQLGSKLRFEAAQVDAYLADDLWLRNARHANAMGERLRTGLGAIPQARVQGSPRANMVFCALPDPVVDALIDRGFVFHHGIGGPGVARFVTSHATTPEGVDGLLSAIGDLTEATRPQT
ncbi:low specificity L-threonine aldolase [Gordonia sp. CPCC 206044]|uniref:threonine aldolase family protein n=1 Tax=Gordonia sp. CPCC 206044 TaxID=3140793 RepID=UPI003AF3F178